MYRVQYLDGDRWRIVNRGDKTVFVGNKPQAEEWLDYQENVQSQSSARTSCFREIVRRLHPCQMRRARLLNVTLAGWARQYICAFALAFGNILSGRKSERPSLRFRRISVTQQNMFRRKAVSSAWLFTWGLALFGVLQIARVDLPWQHGVCGPWGCGPPPQALAACHLFWLVLLFPPALFVIARLPSALDGKAGWILVGTATVGIAAIALYESMTWLPHALDWQRRYFIHRCLFAVATLVEVPLMEALVLGVILWAISFGRAADDLPRSTSLTAKDPVGDGQDPEDGESAPRSAS